jgi:hypothetical protein
MESRWTRRKIGETEKLLSEEKKETIIGKRRKRKKGCRRRQEKVRGERGGEEG